MAAGPPGLRPRWPSPTGSIVTWSPWWHIGLSNKEIAEHLFLAETTVKGYVSEVLARHHIVRDRTQLVVLAYETGVVTPGTAGGGVGWSDG